MEQRIIWRNEEKRNLFSARKLKTGGSERDKEKKVGKKDGEEREEEKMDEKHRKREEEDEEEDKKIFSSKVETLN